MLYIFYSVSSCLSTGSKQIYLPRMHAFDVRCVERSRSVFKRLHLGSCKDGPCLFWVPSSKFWKPRVCFMIRAAWNRTAESLVNGVSRLSTWFWPQIPRRTWKRKSSWPPQGGRWKGWLQSGRWGRKKIIFWILKDFPAAAPLLTGLLHNPDKECPRSQRRTCEVIQKVLMDTGGRRCSVLVYGLRKNSLGRSCKPKSRVQVLFGFGFDFLCQTCVPSYLNVHFVWFLKLHQFWGSINTRFDGLFGIAVLWCKICNWTFFLTASMLWYIECSSRLSCSAWVERQCLCFITGKLTNIVLT